MGLVVSFAKLEVEERFREGERKEWWWGFGRRGREMRVIGSGGGGGGGGGDGGNGLNNSGHECSRRQTIISSTQNIGCNYDKVHVIMLCHRHAPSQLFFC